MLTAFYDTPLVLVSLLVAILASYTALDMAGRIFSAAKSAARWWLLGGAVAMGLGVWSMHFIGMLAFRLPIQLGYDLPITALSLLLAILASLFALWQTARERLPATRLALSALFMGGGIAAMHYTGMAAMRMAPGVRYDPRLFALSVLIAVVASGVALKIVHSLRGAKRKVLRDRTLAALLMGVAIVGMHYTGMAAAGFPSDSVCLAAQDGLAPRWLALVVFVVTAAVLSITLITSVLDARLAHSLSLANQQLQQQVLHDNLTGLPNRTLLDDRLQQAIVQARRDRSTFALMFLDLDGFKAVNDTLGHHVGDQLLVEVSSRIRACVRADDTVARLGGDEFVILAHIAQPDDAAGIAEKLNDTINRPLHFDGQELGISVSIGIAIYPDNGATEHEMMVNADAAMYHTKQSGRNAYCFFEASMNANAHNNLALMQDLRMALDKNQFEIHYQPKIVSPAGPVSGVEALLRWRHPVRGMVGPDVFIALAERTGMIIEIGAWVLRESCRQLKAWHDEGLQHWTVAVNLSALQFSNDALVDLVERILDETGLPPASLTLEVTESVAMKDVEHTLAILNRIVALGVSISIDDFGTGYSSLMYLKRFPAAELKIDRGFVRELGAGTEDAAIVSAIVGLGQSLNLKIVAEGVETEEQHDFLAKLGCDAMQGYWMARPMPPAELITMVNGTNRNYFVDGGGHPATTQAHTRAA